MIVDFSTGARTEAETIAQAYAAINMALGARFDADLLYAVELFNNNRRHPRATRRPTLGLFCNSSTQVAGRFRLETPVPLISYPTGGPSEGELLLTADNGTSVRVVALDASLAQLRLDLDGNGSVDQTFSVPWQDLILQN